MIAGVLPPDHGQVLPGHHVDLGYFPQNHADLLDKTSKQSMIDWLRTKKTNVIEQDIRGVLGKLLFSGDDGLKLIYQLSGGETARLIIASLMLNSFNTLILDEPNNHLDLEAVSALGVGLTEFKGTAIVASHDRDLLTHFATKIIALEEDGIHYHDGPLEEYLKEKALHAS
jgi:ATPase subunit of ABC transporter with duplicated ATPase domains